MDKEIEISKKKIFYRVYGNGKPVMLVHGFGETGDVWKNQTGPPQTPPKEGLSNTQSQAPSNSPEGGELASTLKDKFMLIVPDLPGSGKSEMIDDMSMEGMAEVIKVILDTEAPPTSPKGRLRKTQGQLVENSLQKENIKISESSKVPPSGGFREAGAFLIGHSMGGYITLAFVEKYPGYLRAFGLFHSTAFADTEEKKATRRKGIEFIKEHGAFEFLKNATPNLFSSRSKDEFPGLIDEFVQSLNNFLPEALVSYYESMIKRPDRTAILKNTRMPVLFIMGEFDNAIPLQDGLKQCHLPERAYINILHRSGHMGMLEQADKSTRILEKFLSDN
jgi:pimeloyl-ACP methyl ester carboxylesterase